MAAISRQRSSQYADSRWLQSVLAKYRERSESLAKDIELEEEVGKRLSLASKEQLNKLRELSLKDKDKGKEKEVLAVLPPEAESMVREIWSRRFVSEDPVVATPTMQITVRDDGVEKIWI